MDEHIPEITTSSCPSRTVSGGRIIEFLGVRVIECATVCTAPVGEGGLLQMTWVKLQVWVWCTHHLISLESGPFWTSFHRLRTRSRGKKTIFSFLHSRLTILSVCFLKAFYAKRSLVPSAGKRWTPGFLFLYKRQQLPGEAWHPWQKWRGMRA